MDVIILEKNAYIRKSARVQSDILGNIGLDAYLNNMNL